MHDQELVEPDRKSQHKIARTAQEWDETQERKSEILLHKKLNKVYIQITEVAVLPPSFNY
jgi:hypothetical protein